MILKGSSLPDYNIENHDEEKFKVIQVNCFLTVNNEILVVILTISVNFKIFYESLLVEYLSQQKVQ